MASRERGPDRIPVLAASSWSTVLGGAELAAEIVCRNLGGPGRARLARMSVFAAVASLPWVLWHRVLGEITSEFRLDVGYVLSELSPWLLIAGGTLFLLPVVLSAGRDPESRFYPRARGAYLGWGVTLYLLGTGLAGMVSQLAHLTRV
jgi:hypothetical protein